MAGAAGGFFAGLANAFGSTLLDKKQKAHEEELARQKELSNLYLEGVFNGKLKPETGYGEFAKIVAPILTGEPADGTGKKSGELAGQIAGLMSGLHKGLGVVPPSAGTAGTTDAATTPSQASTDPEGNPIQTLPSRSAMTSQAGSTPPGLAGILVNPDSIAYREARNAAVKAGMTTEAGYDARVSVAKKLLAQGLVKNIDEGMERVGLKLPAASHLPMEGSLGAYINGKLADAEATKGEALTADEQTKIREAARSEWASRSKAATPPTVGTFGDEVTRRETEIGHKLSSGEMLKLSTEWAKSHVTETPAEKTARDKIMADYRAQIATPKEGDFAADITTTTTGKKYIDLSSYDVKSRQKARDWANKNGVTPVSKEQANALVSVDNARLNQSNMWSTIESKLSKDPTGRIVGGLSNKLSALAQTDPDIAAFPAWRESAIQQVRAMQGVGSGQYRLTQSMVDLIINNDIPLITDDVATAMRKISTVRKQLDDVENSITVRDRTTLVTPPGTGGGATGGAAPAPIADRLKAAPPANYRDTATNTYWRKTADDKVVSITKEEYER